MQSKNRRFSMMFIHCCRPIDLAMADRLQGVHLMLVVKFYGVVTRAIKMKINMITKIYLENCEILSCSYSLVAKESRALLNCNAAETCINKFNILWTSQNKIKWPNRNLTELQRNFNRHSTLQHRIVHTQHRIVHTHASFFEY
jgi:hypothetical protein